MWKAGDFLQERKLQRPAAPIPAAPGPATNTISLLTKPGPEPIVSRAAATATTRLSNTTHTITELTRKDTAILLRNAFIDTASKEPLKIPAELKAEKNPGAYIVQARGVITDAFRKRVAAAGAVTVSYIPNNAFLVTASEAVARQLSSDPVVGSVLAYEPYYKLDEKLLAMALASQPLGESSLLRVSLYPGAKTADRAAVASAGGEILAESAGPFGALLTVKPKPDCLVALAQLPQVQGIEPQYRRAAMLDLSRTTLGVSTDVAGSTNATNYLGLTGKGVLINVNDSGVDATHPALKGRVYGITPSALEDTNGHGTLVAGIIASDGAESDTVTNASGSVSGANFRGMAPESELYVLPIDIDHGPLQSDSYLIAAAAKTNATISNDSWGYPGADTYDSSAATYDAAVRDASPETTGSQPILFVFPAGNAGAGATDGSGGVAGSITSPGTAKNVITVGAIEQLRGITNEVVQENTETGEYYTNALFYEYTDSSDQVISSSSRGNVSPGTEGESGRFKPDLVAPGTFVISTRSQQWETSPYSTETRQEEYTQQQIVPGQWNNYQIYVPRNSIALQIVLNSSLTDTSNLPKLQIYGKFGEYVDASYYDASGVGQLTLPGDGALETDAYFSWTIGNNGTDTITYSMVAVLTLTNADSGVYQTMAELNGGLAPYYRYESGLETGTSIAAPAVSGMLALMKEFFEQKLPEGRKHTNSPALMKALLINGARSLGTRYDFQVQTMLNLQGWGLPNLTNSLPSFLLASNTLSAGAPMKYFDQSVTNALATGERRTWNMTLDPSVALAPLRITLVWTDPPGNPNAAVKLVNDLDLVVTNLDTGEVYWGNDIQAETDYNSTHTTNEVAYNDVINNVENVFINTPFIQGTNLSISVIGNRVNVNTVSDTNRTAQDFALVVSCTDLTLTNAFALQLTNSIYATNYPTTKLTNGVPLLEERVGANSPLIGGTLGTTNQWRFYVFTNLTDTNSEIVMTNGTNVAFLTFTTPNLAVPRDTEADIDMYVSTNAALTNLDELAIADSDKSLKRGGNELVFYTNAALGTVFYIGIKAEDQQAAEYGFIALSSDTPFDEATADGGRIIHGMPVYLQIPDGSSRKPGRALMFGVGTQPVEVGRVVVTNVLTHENLGDLLGNLSHEGKYAVLYNHTLNNGDFQGTNGFIFDDSNNGDILYSQPTDGPGSLDEFIGQVAYGSWMLTVSDDHLNQTGRVDRMEIRIYPQTALGGLQGEVLANSFVYYSVDVPMEATNLNVYVWDIDPSLPLNVYVRRAELPTLKDYDKKALIDPEHQNYNETDPVLTLGRGDVPPLVPGRYYIGIYNPNAVTVTFRIDAKIDYDLSGALAQKFTSDVAVSIPDDARVYATNYVGVDLNVVSLSVGVRIDHPRPSDLAVRLTSPLGVTALLTENRGGTSGGGYGAGTTNTGISYFYFTENTNLTTTPIKFGVPPFDTATSQKLIASDSFESYTSGVYTNGTNFGSWSVTSNEVEVVVTPLATNGNQVVNLRHGAISNIFDTVASHKYLASIAYRRSEAMPGAVSWWQFEDSITNDFFTNNFITPALLGTNDSGKVGKGLVFVGTNYVSIPASDTLNTRSFTWEGWVKPNAVSQTNPIFGFSSKTNEGVNLWITNNGSLFADIMDTNGTSHSLMATNVIVSNDWYHVALTFDQSSGAARVYVGGTLITNASFTNIVPQTSLGLFFGYYPFTAMGNAFKGMMDEVVWYNRALTQIEIAEIAQAGTDGHYLTGNPPESTAVSGLFSVVGISSKSLTPTNGWQVETIEFTAAANSTPITLASLGAGFLVDMFSLVEVVDGSYYQAEESLDIFKDQSALGDWILEIEDVRTGATTGPTPVLLSWQMQIIFATPAATAITLTNAVPYCGTVKGGEISYFIVETPRAASYATNVLVNNSAANLILIGDRSGLPAGIQGVDDYYVDEFGAGLGESLLLSTNSPLAAPLVPGARYYLGVKNADTTTTNDYCIKVTFDKTDATNYIDVITLTNHVPYFGSISNGPALDYYQYIVSTNAVSVQFNLFPSNGNVNLVARKYTPVLDPLPNTSKYDASSRLDSTNTEVISLTNNSTPVLSPGIWYLGVVNMESYRVNYSILVNEKIVRIIDLTNGVPLTYTNGAGELEDFFRFRITETNSSAWFGLTNLSGKGDLVLRLNDLPSSAQCDAGRFGGSSDKEINLSTNGTPTPATVADTNNLDILLSVSDNNLVLSWNSLPGATYQVLGIVDVADTNWTVIEQAFIASETNSTYEIPLPTPYLFFAVVSTAFVPSDLVLPDLNGDWYLAVINHESTNLSFTIQATAVPAFTPLTPGVTEVNTLQPSPHWKYYTYEVTTNTLVSLIQATPLDGDIGLYIRKDNTNRLFWPTLSLFDAASDNSGLVAEQILLSSNSTPAVLTPGLWYIGVYNAGTNEVNFNLDIFEYTQSPPFLVNGVAATNLVPVNTMDYYWFVVATNAYKTLFETFNATGNVDLYVRRGLPNPSPDLYDYAGTNGGATNESITILTNATPVALAPGLWIVGVSNADTVPVGYSIRATQFVTASTNRWVDDIHLGVTNGMIYITWASTVGTKYRVDGCTNIITPVWTTVTNIASATATKTTVAVPLSSGLRYFRILEFGTGSVVNPGTNTVTVDNIKITVVGANITISWPSTIGLAYRVDGCTNIFGTQTNWISVSNITAATATNTSVVVPISSGLHFFRVLEFSDTPVTPPSTNSVSIDNLKLSVTSTTVSITWESTNGVTYQVEATTNVANATNWITVTNIVAVGASTTVTMPLSQGFQFFRVTQLGGDSTETTPPTISTTTSELTDNGFVLRWTATAGQKFMISYSDDLVKWTELSAIITAPANGSCEYTDATASSSHARYYQLILVP